MVSSDIPLAHAIQEFLQEHSQANRSPKTLAWHQVALGFLQRYLHRQEILFIQGVTLDRIQSWIRWLQETPGRWGLCAPWRLFSPMPDLLVHFAIG
jgi:hypothetical protein